MGITTGIIAAIGATATAAGTVYGAVKSNEARKKQEEFSREQAAKQDEMFRAQAEQEQAARDEQKKLQDEQAALDAESELQEGAKQRRETAKNRQKRLALGATGRSDTILTGAKGVTEEPGAKTILGV